MGDADTGSRWRLKSGLDYLKQGKRWEKKWWEKKEEIRPESERQKKNKLR